MWSRFRLPLRGLAQVFMTHDNALTIDGNDHKRSRPLGLPELISLFVERVEVFGCPDYQLLDLPLVVRAAEDFDAFYKEGSLRLPGLPTAGRAVGSPGSRRLRRVLQRGI